MARADAAQRPTAARAAKRSRAGRPGSCVWRSSLLACAMLLGGCATLRTDYVKSPSTAVPPAFDTASGRYVAAELDRHPGKCGFRLLVSGSDALMSRIWLIDHAKHSVDLQYFIFENDATGRLVSQRLLAAADRGVRVRLLLDDITLKNEDRLLGALAAHPNIEVRVFNPFRTRAPSLVSKVVQFAFESRRLNRRMHNKSMIVDGYVAVIGGRNIGDAYFDASGESNFRDLDLLIIGPVVGAADRAFDEYWNSNAAYPMQAYATPLDDKADLTALRVELSGEVRAFAQSDYAKAVLEELPHGATGDRPGHWVWGEGTLLVDQPRKIETDHDEPALRIGPKVREAMDGAQRELLLISSYLVPSRRGVHYFSALERRGVAVRILTNSLASTDDPAAEAGYERSRHALLEGGAQLYELRPSPRQPARRITASRSAGTSSLHAKAIVVDRHFVFIGSMNLDPRSRLLNTEMGVLVESPELAAEVADFFEQAIKPDSAYHVQLEKGRVTWSWDDHGHIESAHRDPEVRTRRKLEVDVLRLLPIEGLL
ncbi:MAG TPA: phospholipase D family protein [Steroidobacteraceae bacterium]|nr:phospholipase D family protein [Steroidobacteraceae bacterium]